MVTLSIDFETRSACDLPKCGVHIYATDPTTDILCMGYAFGQEPVELLTPKEDLPPRILEHVLKGYEIAAFNAAFEFHLWNEVAVKRYDWPPLDLKQMRCTQAEAYAMGLPGSLANAAAALNVEIQKDLSGRRIMMQLSQPREILSDGQIYWWDDPDKFEKLYQYCRTDVEVERLISTRILRLSALERSVWLLDQKINNVGICADIAGVKGALEIIKAEKGRLTHEIQLTSGNRVATPQAVGQIREFLKDEGFDAPNVAKGDVVALLARPDLTGKARRVLELRQEAGKASTAKLVAMACGASRKDWRIRGTFQYSGANTRRWAGRRIQLQNLPRGRFSPQIVDEIIGGISDKNLDAETISLLYGSPLDVISSCVRGFLIPAKDYKLLACDFSAIEARVIAWLADEVKALEIFRGDGKIYEHAASDIFRVSVEGVNKDQRQVGKVSTLALGFGGGVGALQAMCKAYGIKLEPARDALFSLATPEQRANTRTRFREAQLEMDYREFEASELIKIFWRQANPAIVKFWSDLESAAIRAVRTGETVQATRNIKYKLSGSFLFCQLPSGGVLSYPYPEIKMQTTPWGSERQSLTYKSEDSLTKKWQRGETYGGSLAENVVQAVSRDLLAESMLAIDAHTPINDAHTPINDAQKITIVGHVHDEVICEVKDPAALAVVKSLMESNPAWAPDLPLGAEGWVGTRYRK